ncbi:MAG: hypothetical protein EHM56_11195 [Chloroflexi bacterium]|nr:MAG: hypothetical protein EHM56_11195 [Chloroflexota bacterium]
MCIASRTPGVRPNAPHRPAAHCEGIFSSEFKHGPLSAVHDGYPVLFIAAPGEMCREAPIAKF